MQEVSTKFGVPAELIRSHKRDRRIKLARWTYWRALYLAGYTVVQCAKETGHDHSSVSHGIYSLWMEFPKTYGIDDTYEQLKHLLN